MPRRFAFFLLLAITGCASHNLYIVRDDRELWTSMVRTLREDATLAVPADNLTPAQRAWADVIESRRPRWEAEIADLARLFAPVPPPTNVRIVIGNGGAEDAFTHDPRTIGFDLARLQAEYGDASSPDNLERIDRFFRHEYTHLLQKAWLARHPYIADTPLRTALLGIWTEGLGNYYSLSARWQDAEMVRKTLVELEPRYVERMAALACASDAEAPELLRGLSMGPFTQKWGALPAALWLAEEQRRSPDALRQFVVAGPDGVWALSDRHLDTDARAKLQQARVTCTRATSSDRGPGL